MSDLVIISPDPQPEESTIGSGDFWPAIEPEEIRTAQRIDSSVVPERLRDVLVEAIATVNDQLAEWAATQTAATLAEVEAPTVDEESIHVHRYRRAVGCLAKAALIERYRDMDTSATGDRKADATEPTIDDLRRDALWSIRDIKGKSRTTVELI
jgi:hypothetical protein